jgi:hypothetical protein
MNYKVRLRRVGPVSVGKIMALIYLVMGLIFGGFALLIASVAPQPAANAPIHNFPFSVTHATALIFMIIFYPIVGFIGGVISAFIYNLAAGVIGGIEMDLGDDSQRQAY